jgi:hypothetical protein
VKLELIFILVFVFFDLKAKTHAWAIGSPTIFTVLNIFVKFCLIIECTECKITEMLEATQVTETRLFT